MHHCSIPDARVVRLGSQSVYFSDLHLPHTHCRQWAEARPVVLGTKTELSPRPQWDTRLHPACLVTVGGGRSAWRERAHTQAHPTSKLHYREARVSYLRPSLSECTPLYHRLTPYQLVIKVVLKDKISPWLSKISRWLTPAHWLEWECKRKCVLPSSEKKKEIKWNITRGVEEGMN